MHDKVVRIKDKKARGRSESPLAKFRLASILCCMYAISPAFCLAHGWRIGSCPTSAALRIFPDFQFDFIQNWITEHVGDFADCPIFGKSRAAIGFLHTTFFNFYFDIRRALLPLIQRNEGDDQVFVNLKTPSDRQGVWALA